MYFDVGIALVLYYEISLFRFKILVVTSGKI